MEYKRLTERRGNLIIDKCGNCENVSNPQGCTDKCCYEVMKTRLCELEDKIEQGTLIELPCKVGDTVYGFSCYRQFGSLSGKIFKGKVVAFYIERGLYLRIEAEHDNGNFYLEYGKDVFLTREEAEKRLKELE